MIEFQTELYCQNCEDFDPTFRMNIQYENNFEKIVQTFLYCKHKERCEKLYSHAFEDALKTLRKHDGDYIMCKECIYENIDAPPGIFYCVKTGEPINQYRIGTCNDAERISK